MFSHGSSLNRKQVFKSKIQCTNSTYIDKLELPQKIPLELIAFCLLHKQQEYFGISKARVSDGDGDKTVRSEISYGGYIAADGDVALPKYLVHLPSQNCVMMNIDVDE